MAGGTLSVTFGSGFEITQLTVLTSFSSTATLKNLPPEIDEQKIVKTLHSHLSRKLPTHCIRLEENSPLPQATIKFGSPAEAAEAAEAVAKLDQVLHEGDLLSCKLLDSAATRTDAFKLACSWNLPSCMGYAHFSTEYAADEALKSAPRMLNSTLRYRRVPTKEFRGVIQYTVQFFGFPPEATEMDLRATFPEAMSFHVKPLKYAEPQYQIVAMIQSLFEKHGGLKVKFKVTSKPDQQRQNAIVMVEDATTAEQL